MLRLPDGCALVDPLRPGPVFKGTGAPFKAAEPALRSLS